MKDLELLAQAAKVMGNDVWTDCDGNLYSGEPEMPWNPLKDDGDAFRLAVNLGIGFIPDYEVGEVNTTYMIGRYGYNTNEEFESCPLSATRRAIVRAAAAMGENL